MLLMDFIALTNGKPLLSERIECWPYGPVINSTYHEFKNFGGQNILIRKDESFQAMSFDDDALHTLNLTWSNCNDLNAIQLSNWTHIEGSPWKRAMDEGRTDIPDSYILEYFKRFITNQDHGTIAAAATPEN